MNNNAKYQNVLLEGSSCPPFCPTLVWSVNRYTIVRSSRRRLYGPQVKYQPSNEPPSSPPGTIAPLPTDPLRGRIPRQAQAEQWRIKRTPSASREAARQIDRRRNKQLLTLYAVARHEPTR